MNAIPLRPERQQELEKFAHEHGQTPADALDEAVASYLEWRSRDFEEAVDGIRQGYQDVKDGLTRPAAEFFADMHRKYDSPG